MKKEKYIRDQIFSHIDIPEYLDKAFYQISQRNKNRNRKKLYNEEQIVEIVRECDNIMGIYNYTNELWHDRNKKAFSTFLEKLVEGDYPKVEEHLKRGKRREYLDHIRYFLDLLPSDNQLIIDLGGRTGWASTIMRGLGYYQSYTLEFNPKNIIFGRYVWGHKNIYHGDANALRACKFDGIYLSEGNLVDAVFCRYCFKHFVAEKAFNEIAYILKPGGLVLIIVVKKILRAFNDIEIQHFPDLSSLTKHASDLVLTRYELLFNSETNNWHHFAVFKKPDRPDLYTPAQAKSVIAENNNIFRRCRLYYYNLKHLIKTVLSRYC